MKKNYWSLVRSASVFLLLLMTLAAHAQKRLVTGTITDAGGNPIPGVNVIIKGTTTGLASDANGTFSIEAVDEDILVISFIGYTTKEVKVGNQTKLAIELTEDVSTLQEVVVVGYGEMRKADITTAMTSISAKDLNRTVNTTFDQAIQGRSAGVYVTQNTGAPGGGVSINIRGVNSLSGSNEPLYVVDGVQIQGGTSTTGTNPMSSLNPSDIENIEILQGPNATAIYGSRGTNGVVLITTKRGKSGGMKVNYSYSYSMQDRPQNLEVMNLQQFAQMQVEYKTLIGDEAGIREEFRDPSLLGSGSDWQKAMFQKAAMQKHQISFSGGTDKGSYYLSGERMMQDGVGLNSGFDRTSVRLNMDNQVRNWLSIGTNIMVSQTDQKLGTMGTSMQNTWNNLILNAIYLAPDIPVTNADGTYGGGDASVSTTQQFSPPNPVGLANIVTNDNTTRTLIGGVSAGIKIIEGLEFRTNFNTNIGSTSATTFYPTYEFSPYQLNLSARLWEQANSNTYWGWNQMLTYNKEIGKHRINAMVMHEAQESNWKNLMGFRSDFPGNNILDLNVGDVKTASNSGGQGQWAMESYLGRINYNYDDRYIVTAAYRADGTSNFGPGQRWGYFPSVSAAYRISKEKFFDVPKINDLRLRFETGITGNQGNGGAIYGTLNSGPSQWGTSFYPAIYSNPNFKWEETKTFNYGLTLGVFDGRIQLDVDYYIKKTDNLILQSTLPWYTGTSGAASIGAPYVNIGSLDNKGWGVSLTTENINSNGFRWTSNFNISGFQSKVTSLTTETGQIDRVLGQPKGNQPFTQRSVVGKAPWQFVGNIQEGIYTSAEEANNSARPVNSSGDPYPVDEANIWVGDAKYKDVNNDGVIDEKDLTFIGSPWPKWFGGFTNNFSYKGFDLSMLITFSYGNQIYNLTKDEGSSPGNINVGRNMFSSTLNYAKVGTDPDGNAYLINAEASIPRIQSNKGVNNNFDRYTSAYVEDGSYARLKNVTLTYNIPTSWLSKLKVIQGARVAVSGQNLLTVTKYTGYDPEVEAYVGPSYNGDALSSTLVGVDYGRYPLTRVYSFTIGIDF